MQGTVTRQDLDKINHMRMVAASKVMKADGSLDFFADLERNLDQLAFAKVKGMAPVNENLLGIAYMLLCETRRLKQQSVLPPGGVVLH